jgi:hypothetical protein
MEPVNGVACSIEMYVGRDLLEDDDKNLLPVELKGFIHGVGRRQGVVAKKETIQRVLQRKADAALAAAEPPNAELWADLDSIIRMIIEAHQVRPAI